MNFRLFFDRNFSLFVLRQSLFLFATICLNVSLALYILNMTGSAGKFASILALGLIPQIILGPFAGALVDRLDKRRLLLMLDIVRGLYLLLLFALSLFHAVGELFIYITVLFFAACDMLTVPAFATLLQAIVKKEILTQANALDSTMSETVRVFAPVLGTVIYSASGIETVFFCNGMLSLLSAAATLFMPLPTFPKTAKHSSIIYEIWDGLQIFRTDIRIASLVANGFLTHIFMFPFVMIGFPYMIKQVFGGSDIDFGLVESAQTAGSLCAIFGVAFLQKRYSIPQNIGIGILGMVVAVLPMLLLGSTRFLQLLQTSPLAVLLFYAAVGFLLYLMFSTYGVFFRTFYQQTVDTSCLGRFVSVMGMIFAIGRLIGFQMYGGLFDSVDLLYSVIVLGIGMLLKILVHIPFLQEEKRRSKRMIQVEN